MYFCKGDFLINIEYFRKLVGQRLKGLVKTPLAIVGPCSIYDEEETLIYEDRLRALQKELGNSIVLFMRAFVEKSRTSYNWRGFVYQRDLSKPEDILEGIEKTRKLFSQLETPLAMECVDPNIFPFLEDLLSWGFIGARTSTSTTHRILASGATIPFGFKNSLDGDVSAAIHSCLVANQSHCILTKNGQSLTNGNPHTHIVLRGGYTKVNYTKEEVDKAYLTARALGVFAPMLIDCSHGNSPNKPDGQKISFLESIDRIKQSPEKVFGVMLESNILKGASTHCKQRGVSFTDPCISFEETRELLLTAAERITRQHTEESDQPTFYAYSH